MIAQHCKTEHQAAINPTEQLNRFDNAPLIPSNLMGAPETDGCKVVVVFFGDRGLLASTIPIASIFAENDTRASAV